MPITLGFFSRLLDEATAAERYQLAIEQIVHAESHGFQSAWVAQHHLCGDEGGLPSPLVFLSHVAARTRDIRLGTGIVTLPLENALRVAEDAVVLDLLSGGRLELGVGSGGTPSTLMAFGLHDADRAEIFAQHLTTLRNALAGRPLPGGRTMYPAALPNLGDRIWQATFSVQGGTRAGLAGDGLMLSRTQPRHPDARRAPLSDLQHPIIDAYLAALPAGREPRIVASRSIFVADDRRDAMRFAKVGLQRQHARFAEAGMAADGVTTLDDLIAAYDVHLGTPDDVVASLRADSTLTRATDLVCQVHSVDPPHPYILRSIELIAREVAPAIGWSAATSSSFAASAAPGPHA